ncbi:MAG TPA: DUF3108 domain-containing protein [bacterium]|nr:DUF3108 domain-containing protein [bacterium]HPR86636.1 DUF3108 domain-containing protein [bacterium]
MKSHHQAQRWAGWLYFIALCLLPALLSARSALPPGDASQPLAFAETLRFSLSFKGMGAARAVVRFQPGDPQQIEARIDTRTLTSLIFSIHNLYRTEVDPASRLPRTVHKTIDQSNIRQELTIHYDRITGTARGGELGSWPFLPGAMDLFTMLYRLRQLSPVAGDSLSFPLDIESQAWLASGRVSDGGEESTPLGRVHVRQVTLRFSRSGSAVARAWKTDLLTNRIARPEGMLTILLGPPPQNLPLQLQFGPEGQRVVMRLQALEKGN